MEEELTCPVCLELYADPLMLPCSHSVCKKCLQDILDNRTKKKKSKKDLVLDCPSCRKEVHLNKERLEGLPRNLALENVVIRYTEERSRSIRKSLSLESPVADMLLSPLTSSVDQFPCTSKALCDLCESISPSKAAWHCVQCEVCYCQSCFAKYHPRRGALARHKIRQPQDGDGAETTSNCKQHDHELASLFCDRCKALVCHLCVCQGDGLHAGHTILAPDTACKRIKECLGCTKEESDCLLAVMLEQKGKIDALLVEMQDNHREAVVLIEQQYERLLADIHNALQAQKLDAMTALHDAKLVFQTTTTKYLESNNAKVSELEGLSRKCHKFSVEKKTRKILEKSKDIAPITDLLKQYQKQVEEVTREYEGLVKDKTARSAISNTAACFGTALVETLSIFFDRPASVGQPSVPLIISPSPLARGDAAPRISNKCLTTWGFTSTTFTAEQQSTSISWTVTVERSVGQAGPLNSGYLFGVGLSNVILNVKDMVGMGESSHGVVCTNGMLQYCHNGHTDDITALNSLPLTLTLSLNCAHAQYNVLTYRVESNTDKPGVIGSTLVTKKLLHDAASKEFTYPVFTVSQRVKLLFPTCV